MTTRLGRQGLGRRIGGVAFSVAAWAAIGGARASDLSPAPAAPVLASPAPVPTWHFYSAAYLWAASVKGDARVLPPLPTSKVDVGFLDSLKDVEGGVIATGFARYGRYLAVIDIIGSRSTPSQAVSALGVTGTLSTVSKFLTTMGAVGYRVFDGPQLTIDAYAGGRVWMMENTLTLTAPGLVNAGVNKRQVWADALVGGQIRYEFQNNFYVNTIGFVGAGGAQFEGDIYAGVGYRISDRYDVYAGYRALRVNYEKGPFLYRVTQHGPILGLGIRF